MYTYRKNPRPCFMHLAWKECRDGWMCVLGPLFITLLRRATVFWRSSCEL